MKSLTESLFDKDITSKKLPYFGEYYEVSRVNLINDDYNNGGFLASQDEFLSWLKNTVRLPMLKKDFKSVKIDNKKDPVGYEEHIYGGLRANEQICEIAGYIIAAINTIPIEPKNVDTFASPMSSSALNEKVKPYLKFYGGMSGTHIYTSIDTHCIITITLSRSDKEMKITFKKK